MCIPGFSADGGQRDGSLSAFLGSLLMEDRQIVLSVHTWVSCLLRKERWFCQYVPGLSADGGQGDASLIMYLDSLLVEDREMVLLCTYLDSLLMEERDNFLSEQTWTLCWGRTGRWSFFCSLYVPRLSASGR